MVSRFGTTKEMVIESIETADGARMIAIDNRGLYLTEAKYLDRPIADPNRSSHRAAMEARIKELGVDTKAMFDANKGMIQALPKETSVKVNPLKASKRSMKK
ncbi:MAG: hypothetical protein R3Y11_06470 [Pseudomonadota bacterium]